ncbi:MAG: hypothetical protein WDL87_10580 [Candidatus Omnitrophota bacterium]
MRAKNIRHEKTALRLKAASGQGNIFILIILVVVIVGLVNFFVNSPRKVSIDGNKVSIKFGGHTINAVMEDACSLSFLVNNAFYNNTRIPSFFVIPMKTANKLKRQYGDFVHCDSPGARAGQESLQTICLLPLNKAVEKKIRKIMKERYNLPVIEIAGAKLDINEHRYLSKMYSSYAPQGEEYYLIEDVSITQLHYQ